MTKIWTGHEYQCTIIKFDLERLSVTLTFKLGTWVLRMTLPLTVLYICTKLYQNPSINDKDMDRTHYSGQTDRPTD